MTHNETSTMEDGTRYKSEVFVPIQQQDSMSTSMSGSQHEAVWNEMHERMELRRQQWNDEVSRMRSEFFRSKPDEKFAERKNDNATDKLDVNNMFYSTADGTKLFRVSFDVSHFAPDEISIKTQDRRLIVHAKHEDKGVDKSVSREFNRQIDIPQNVDPRSLRSSLDKNGILHVDAVVGSSSSSTTAGGNGLPRGQRVDAAAVDGTARLTSSSMSRLPQPQHSGSASSNSAPGGGGCTARLSTSTLGTSAGRSVTERDGQQIFRIVVDIGTDFDPADINVKTVDRKLVIHARHEEKAEGRTSSRELSREFDLPDAIDPETVTASMTSDGRLIVEAPIASYSQGAFSGSSKQPTITVSFGPSPT